MSDHGSVQYVSQYFHFITCARFPCLQSCLGEDIGIGWHRASVLQQVSTCWEHVSCTSSSLPSAGKYGGNLFLWRTGRMRISWVLWASFIQSDQRGKWPCVCLGERERRMLRKLPCLIIQEPLWQSVVSPRPLHSYTPLPTHSDQLFLLAWPRFSIAEILKIDLVQ